jgi:hypothetical protein
MTNPATFVVSALAMHDRLQGPAGSSSVMAQGGGDVGVPAQAQDADGQVRVAMTLGPLQVRAWERSSS